MPERTGGDRWMTAAAAQVYLEISRGQLYSIVERGLLTSRRIPGARLQVLRDDAVKLAESAVIPARATA